MAAIGFLDDCADMKWVLIVVLVLALASGVGVWAWGHRGTPGHEIVFTWNHRDDPSMPDCSATLRRHCVTGFTLTDMTDEEVISDKIPTTARSYTYRPEWEIEPGFRHVFTLTEDGYGTDGAPIRSAEATVIVVNPKWRFGQSHSGAVVK